MRFHWSILFCLVLLDLLGSILGGQNLAKNYPNYITEAEFARAKSMPKIGSGSSSSSSAPSLNYQNEGLYSYQNFTSTKNAKRDTQQHWPNARVPYSLSDEFTDTERGVIAQSLNEYHTKTCVRFTPRHQENDDDYVIISKNDEFCGLADMCRKGGPQTAQFGSKCTDSHTIIHELAHTLCFDHEMQRPDMNDWLTWDDSKCGGHYRPNDASEFTTLDLLFDYASVMFYPHLCILGCATPKLSGVTKCGTKNGLTVLDAEKINSLYNCGGCFAYRFRPISKLNYVDRYYAVPAGSAYGNDQTTLYPCRVYHNGDITPGHWEAQGQECKVGYQGKEYAYGENFEILTNPDNAANLQWQWHSNGESVPVNAVPGGRDVEAEPIYLARCTFKFQDDTTATYPGKVYKNQATAGVHGNEYGCGGQYEILVCA